MPAIWTPPRPALRNPALRPVPPANRETRFMDVLVPVSVGELLDKITILRIKSERMQDAGKRANVDKELAALDAVARHHGLDRPDIAALTDRLQAINERLWVIEDDIRDCEIAADFGPRFIELARAVYVTNDERARVKKDINLATGSAFIEEKSYKDYGGAGTG